MQICKKVIPQTQTLSWPPTISATRKGYFFRSPLEWLTWPFFFFGGIYVIPPHPNGWVCQEPKLRTGIGYLKLGKVFPLKKNSGCETLRILEVNHWPPILGCHKFTQNIHVRLIRVNLVDLLCLFCFTWICFTSFISNIIISTWCFVSSSFLTHATLGVQRWLVCFSSCLFLVCSRGTHQRDQWLHPGLNVKKWMFVEKRNATMHVSFGYQKSGVHLLNMDVFACLCASTFQPVLDADVWTYSKRTLSWES